MRVIERRWNERRNLQGYLPDVDPQLQQQGIHDHDLPDFVGDEDLWFDNNDEAQKPGDTKQTADRLRSSVDTPVKRSAGSYAGRDREPDTS